MTRNQKVATLLICLLWFGLATARSGAHGIGKPQLLNEAAGPYLLSAWTDPDPLREDEAHVVVAVTDPVTREPIVEGIAVTVSLTAADDPSVVVTQTAGTDNVNQLFYAAEFNNRLSAGRWRVGLSVAGGRGGGESAGFEVDIEPARGFNWLWLGVGGLALIVVGWMAASMRSETPPRSRRNSSAAP